MPECSVCRSKLVSSPSTAPILVYMSKVDGKFKFSPVTVNFLTEAAKVLFALVMLLIQARNLKFGEKPILSISSFTQAARNNVLLAVPAFLYAINNYLKFIRQLYFDPTTVKMLSNLKVLVIAVLLKVVMKQRLSIIQVSVFNEYALKSQFDTSIYLQNLFLYGYGAIFNFLAIIGIAIFKGPGSFSIPEGHSKATMLLIFNNAAQGILSSFFFKYAGTILRKYSSIVATIFTGFASAALNGHRLAINFFKDEPGDGPMEILDVQKGHT
ncbi:hypothetical protein MKW92_051517, partial [Papaver armeniacum]